MKQLKFITFIISLWSILSLCGCGKGKHEVATTHVYQDSLESLFREVPEWLMTLYDSVSGGFYNNTLMKQSGHFEPDLQSTAFAVTMLSRMNEPDDINLGRDIVNMVSDMNGTHLAITARKSLYELIDRPAPEIPVSDEVSSFFYDQ